MSVKFIYRKKKWPHWDQKRTKNSKNCTLLIACNFWTIAQFASNCVILYCSYCTFLLAGLPFCLFSIYFRCFERSWMFNSWIYSNYSSKTSWVCLVWLTLDLLVFGFEYRISHLYLYHYLIHDYQQQEDSWILTEIMRYFFLFGVFFSALVQQFVFNLCYVQPVILQISSNDQKVSNIELN